ncbi:hypothetical protein PT274_01420 [Leuconostocaceae bacterium ESL0958]|nr:hypothetical protein [Leuconostocaceae bacterium ESL0958]
MADVKQWLVAKEDLNKEYSFKISEYLPEFKIKTLTGTKLDELQRAATKTRRTKSQVTQTTDQNQFISDLIESSVVEPNLLDNEIQEYYGTVGDAAGTVRAMLTAGQYQNLIEKIQEVNNFDPEEEVEEAKK